MIVRYGVVLAVIFLLASGFGAAGDKKDGTDQLQGEWLLVSSEIAGTKREIAKDRKLVVKGDEWMGPIGGKLKFKIDATKTPKQLDLMRELDGKELTWRGIYKIEGTTLTFCRSHVGDGERPKEFKGGPGVVLMVYKRAEK